MHIHCTVGVTQIYFIGDLPVYGVLWDFLDAIVNIQSFAEVQSQFQVSFDNKDRNKFIVHKPNGDTKVFQQS